MSGIRVGSAVAVVLAVTVTAAAGAPTAAATLTTAVPAVAAPAVVRTAGADRYATAVALSRVSWSGTTRPERVYLATGQDFADALSASAAAASTEGAVLLTPRASLPDVVRAELVRLAPEEVVVVGGTAAVSAAVASTVRGLGPAVVRVAGDDRYATSVALVRRATAGGPAPLVWVATGRDYPDALVAGAAAGAERAPLLVLDGARSSLRSDSAALLADLDPDTVRIAGGTGAVSAATAAALGDVAATATRHAGPDRYATSVAVMRAALPELAPGTAAVASGTSFADALTAAAWAGLARRPLHLSLPWCVPSSVRTSLSGPAVTTLRLVGGPAALRGLVGRLEACRSLSTPSSTWVVVNKRRPVAPRSYVPSGLVVPDMSYADGERLRPEAAAALAALARAVRAAGAGTIGITSGYRSYSTQSVVYRNRVATHGTAYADRWIARPGHSEHQLGYGVDLRPVGSASCAVHTCFGSTSQGRWVRENAWRHGFVVRYEPGWSHVVGFDSEPWHLRYVGPALAADYRAAGWHTLEQYLDLPAAPTY